MRFLSSTTSATTQPRPSEGIHSLVLKANRINVQQFIVPANCSEIDILIDNMDDIKSITARA